jgi:hypothetical protein
LSAAADPASVSGRDATCWRVSTDDFLVFAEAGETILYSLGSGRTVYLDPAATVLFHLLSRGPMPATVLPSALAARWEVAEAEIDIGSVNRVMAALLDSGVVERHRQ